jgi:NADH-quinone oxidoreductase subunit A
MFREYSLLLLYMIFSLIFIVFLILLSIFAVYHNLDLDKNSSYECGFHPFEDARLPFEVRFYLVGVLFIIFDLEIVFLFP